MRLPAVAAAPPKLPLLLALPLLLLATPAFADATLFIGSTTTPSNRVARGASIGISLLVIGFEFEYADTSEDLDEAAPSLRTGMGNVLLQTPFPIAGMQFYATTGAGGYREQLGEEAVQQQETHIAFNTGGGVKVSLLGPVRVRLDYRLFKLRGEPLHSTVHRVYAGLNLAF
jgi:opacity protein-like surface antigen